MKCPAGEPRTSVATTLQQVRAEVMANEQFSPIKLLRRSIIAMRVTALNLLLWVLRSWLFKRRGYPTQEFKRIVVYTVGILGDNVVMLAAIAALRHRYPQAHITWLVNAQTWNTEGARGLLNACVEVDRFQLVNDGLVTRHGFRLRLDRVQVPDVVCELFVNLSPFGNRGWAGAVVRELAMASMLGATHAVGFHVATCAGASFRTVQHYFTRNEPRRAAEVLQGLGIALDAGACPLPHSEAARARVQAMLAETRLTGRPLAVIHPGAKFEIKCWPVEHFGALARWLNQKMGFAVLITGTGAEQQRARDVAAESGGTAENWCARTNVQELIELLRMADVCVTNDTGTMHLSATAGTPTVAIFSTRVSPTHWFPRGPHVVALFRLLGCSYCGKDNNDCDHLSCLKMISVDEVITATRALLGVPARSDVVSLPISPSPPAWLGDGGA